MNDIFNLFTSRVDDSDDYSKASFEKYYTEQKKLVEKVKWHFEPTVLAREPNKTPSKVQGKLLARGKYYTCMNIGQYLCGDPNGIFWI